LPHALLALPFSLASGNPILGYNLALILSFVLSGFACYLLVRRMTRNAWAGLAAGIVFSFNAYKMSNLAQVQLLTLQWLPLACSIWTGLSTGAQNVEQKQATGQELNLPVALCVPP